jgi:hypothetical protein
MAPPAVSARRAVLVLLAAAACLNVGAGVALALRDPGRASDLQAMYDWCRGWLIDGQSLYNGPDASTDYPPLAIVLLSPIALVPAAWLVPIWTLLAVALTPWPPYLVLRSAGANLRVPVVPILLVLCWAATRTLLQFTLLSMTLSCLALAIADAHWLAGGVALGLALFKPHIAGPIALWMLATGRIRPLLAAAAVGVVGWVLYDARIAEAPLATAVGYWHVLGSEYAGAAGLVGNTSIRGWTRVAVVDVAAGDMVWAALSSLMLAALFGLAQRDRSRPVREGGLAVPAMFALWSLLVIYHNGNNLILMLPAFAFCWCRTDRTAFPASHWLPIALLQGALMFDVPVRLSGAAHAHAWLRVVIEQFDRGVVLTTLVWVAALWWRLTRTPAFDGS